MHPCVCVCACSRACICILAYLSDIPSNKKRIDKRSQTHLGRLTCAKVHDGDGMTSIFVRSGRSFEEKHARKRVCIDTEQWIVRVASQHELHYNSDMRCFICTPGPDSSESRLHQKRQLRRCTCRFWWCPRHRTWPPGQTNNEQTNCNRQLDPEGSKYLWPGAHKTIKNLVFISFW